MISAAMGSHDSYLPASKTKQKKAVIYQRSDPSKATNRRHSWREEASLEPVDVSVALVTGCVGKPPRPTNSLILGLVFFGWLGGGGGFLLLLL